MADVLLREIGDAFGVGRDDLFEVVGDDTLPAYFDVTGLAAMSFGVAGMMLSRLCNEPVPVTVDQRLASLWFGLSMRPSGWQLPPIWDAVAGDYRAGDGWIRLHTNAPHHRAAAIAVLDVEEDRDAVACAVAGWDAEALETAIVEAGGCAAVMHSFEHWTKHPQGAAVAKEPLIIWMEHQAIKARAPRQRYQRPLQGLRVLDLTRVLAGPAATRFLAGFGADVLRIDPPGWDEAVAVQEMTLGKRCAKLDLENDDDRVIFEALLAKADVLVHGYRDGALAGLGYGLTERHALNPGLIDVRLNAYGWSGPWSGRRGFDSLVQMSSGIADFGMKHAGTDKPFPLPVQALDHGTGYLMAAAVLHALDLREREGRVLSAKLSLARTAQLLAATCRKKMSDGLPAETEMDVDPWLEKTVWGTARRLRFPLMEGMAPSWSYPAGPLGASPPVWLDDA